MADLCVVLLATHSYPDDGAFETEYYRKYPDCEIDRSTAARPRYDMLKMLVRRAGMFTARPNSFQMS